MCPRFNDRNCRSTNDKDGECQGRVSARVYHDAVQSLSLEDHDLTVSDRTTCSNRSLAIIKTSMVTGLPIWPVVMDSMFDITHRFSTAPGS